MWRTVSAATVSSWNRPPSTRTRAGTCRVMGAPLSRAAVRLADHLARFRICFALLSLFARDSSTIAIMISIGGRLS